MTTETIEYNGIKPGCGFGAINREKIRESERRIADIESKIWTIILLLIGNFVGIVANLLITMGKQ